MFLIAEDVFALYEKIASGNLEEKKTQYHNQIANALTQDYDLAFDVFASCSIEFYQWFSKDYLYEIVEIIRHHNKKELLLVLKAHLLEMVDGNHFDRRISSIDSIYHVTYKTLV